jgi:hypothetical protein
MTGAQDVSGVARVGSILLISLLSEGVSGDTAEAK